MLLIEPRRTQSPHLWHEKLEWMIAAYFFSRSYDILSQLRTIWFEKQNWNQNPKAPFHKILQEHYSDRFLDSYQVFEETIWCEKRLRAVPGSTGKCTQSVHLMKTYGCVYTALFKMITNKVLLYSTWNSAQCYAAAWMGGEFGGEYMYDWVPLLSTWNYHNIVCWLATPWWKIKSLFKM